MPTIKELIKDNTVSFLEYRKGYLYYLLNYAPFTSDGVNRRFPVFYKFAVPISDVGDATFKASDKAIYFMRYIKASLNEGTLVKV